MRGDRLREIREARGLTQNELAAVTGIHPQQIYKIENGKILSPGASTLIALAKCLEVSTDYLLGLTSERTGQLQEEPLSLEEWQLVRAYRRKNLSDLLEIMTILSQKNSSE
jgi:transcriptional regulator with XRE-family HTH domain